MRSYIARRLLLAVFVLVGVSLITFIVARVVPSDPAALYVGGKPNAELIAQARATLHLDRPLYRQYVDYVAEAVRGNLGESLRTKRSVTADIMYFLPSSLQLIVLALLLATLTGIALGAFSARNKGGLLDHSGRVAAIAGVSLPPFFLGLLLQLLFFGWLGWLPVAGASSPDVAELYPHHPRHRGLACRHTGHGQPRRLLGRALAHRAAGRSPLPRSRSASSRACRARPCWRTWGSTT